MPFGDKELDRFNVVYKELFIINKKDFDDISVKIKFIMGKDAPKLSINCLMKFCRPNLENIDIQFQRFIIKIYNLIRLHRRNCK